MTDSCCKMWPKIRPLLSWYMMQDVEESGLLVCPVIGPAVSGAPRVNYCPSCGAPVRDAQWSLTEMEGADG